MKKQLIAIALLSLLALFVLCVPANAPAETKVTIDKEVTFKGGYTTISWKTKGDKQSSFMVFAKPVNSDAKQDSMYLGITSKNKIKTGLLIPGKKYEITVTGSLFSTLGSRTIKVPKAESFTDGKMKASSVKVTMTPVRRKQGSSKDPSTLKSFKAKDIKKALKNDEYEYGVKYHMKMPRLTKGRTYFVQIAFEAPSGYLNTVIATDIEFDRVNNGYQTLWFKILGENFIKSMYKTTNEVPTGKYMVYMFWDGMSVSRSSFTVN